MGVHYSGQRRWAYFQRHGCHSPTLLCFCTLAWQLVI